MGFGWQWCVSVESLIIANVPAATLLRDADNGGSYACGGWEYMGNLCTCFSILYKPKTALKE